MEKKSASSLGDPPATLSADTLSRITAVLANMGGVPTALLADLEAFLTGWGGPGMPGPRPSIPIRPYHIAELAAIKGMPSRGTIYKILQELDIPLEATRTCDGKLAPEVVERILNARKGPAKARIRKSLVRGKPQNQEMS